MSRTIEQDWHLFRDGPLADTLADLDPEAAEIIADVARHAYYLGALAQHERLASVIATRSPRRRLAALDETTAELAEYRQHTRGTAAQIED